MSPLYVHKRNLKIIEILTPSLLPHKGGYIRLYEGTCLSLTFKLALKCMILRAEI